MFYAATLTLVATRPRIRPRARAATDAHLDTDIGNTADVQRRTHTVGSLFSGMGGCLGGAVLAGFKPLWASDFDPECCDTLRHRFPDTRVIEKPIRELSVKSDSLWPVDLLVAGFPCQSFSIGGRQAGFDDERGRSVFDLFRLLGEWGQRRPKVVLLENVPHFARGKDGEWLSEVTVALRRSGYWFSPFANSRIINTVRMTGIPHDRDRFFMVACSTASFNGNVFAFPDGHHPARPIGEFVHRDRREDARCYLENSNRFAWLIENELNSCGDEESVVQIRRYYARSKRDRLCPTLTANMGVGGHNVPFVKDRWGIRKLTVEECAMLQGFEPRGLFPNTVKVGSRYRMIGNAVTQAVTHGLSHAIRSTMLNEMLYN